MLPGPLTETSRIELFPLSILPEDGEFIVGRKRTGTFAALPPIGLRAIELLRAGLPLGQVQVSLMDGPGEEADLEAFVLELVELGFVKAIDGHPLLAARVEPSHLPRLQPGHIAWLFRWPAVSLIGLLVLAASLALLRDPSLAPRFEYFFWSRSTSLALAGNAAWILLNQALHELAHLMAARSLGVPARIGLGTRLHNLVALTDVSGLWAVPRRQRYRVYLAGIVWDLIPLSLAVLLLAHARLPILTQQMLKAILLANWLGIVWQFQLYLRTDLYYVLVELLRARNVYEDALQVLHHIARPWLRLSSGSAPAHPLAAYTAAEARKVQASAIVLFVGSALSLGVFAAYGVPALLALFSAAFGALRSRISHQNLPLVADGAVTILVVSGFLLLYLVTFLNSRGVGPAAILQRIRHRSTAP